MNDRMLRALYVSGPRAYVGDDIEVDENTIRVRGGGCLLQSFEEAAAVSLQCTCNFGDPGAKCQIQLSGTAAACIVATTDARRA
jgi:hypothetical protein